VKEAAETRRGGPVAGPPPTSGGSVVTLVEGSSFCASAPSGDVERDGWHGLFVADTRVLSCWSLTIEGRPAEPLTVVDEGEPYRATFVSRASPRHGLVDSTLLVLRSRYVGDGLREDIVLRNFGPEAVSLLLRLTVDADFADLFAVKERRAAVPADVTTEARADGLQFGTEAYGGFRWVQITATGSPQVAPGQIDFPVVVPARSEWSTCLSVQVSVAGRPLAPRHRCGEPLDLSPSARRMQAWRLSSPRAASPDSALVRTLRSSVRDLGALQIQDPEHPERRVVAAGAPWFMALFGRDALLSSWMALPVDPTLALGTLQTLARYQGAKEDPRTEEQPGRILHEVRLGAESALALGGGRAYYGTADATPLFVALLGELHRWGLPEPEVAALVPAADRALHWIDRQGDLNGDGFVAYRRATDLGLANQGWKDSFDAINRADGRLAAPPIALAEVQGYAYAAFLARAELADALGDGPRVARHWRERAAALKAAFNERFWMPDKQAYAVALDGAGEQVDSVTSNMGHCLWSGIVERDKAQAVARHLLGPRLWTGFGVRTLADDMGAYNPVSYHNGSVWPHDTAIAAAGLARYGFRTEVQQLAIGLLDAAQFVGSRLPELFCGFDRAEFGVPVPYPTSCSPQAWAAAAPLLLVRSLLGLDPDVPAGVVQMAPAFPEHMLPLQLSRIPLAGTRVDAEVRVDGWRLDGLPDGVRLVGAGGSRSAPR
jgi:glycogen debranching enzyme